MAGRYRRKNDPTLIYKDGKWIRAYNPYVDGLDVTTRARNILGLIRITNADDIRRLGKVYFLRTPECGRLTAQEIGNLIGEDWSSWR